MRLVSVVTIVLLAGVAGCGGSIGYSSSTGPGDRDSCLKPDSK